MQDAMNRSTVARWFKQLHEGRRLMEDDAHTSHPTSTIDNISIFIVSTLLEEDT